MNGKEAKALFSRLGDDEEIVIADAYGNIHDLKFIRFMGMKSKFIVIPNFNRPDVKKLPRPESGWPMPPLSFYDLRYILMRYIEDADRERATRLLADFFVDTGILGPVRMTELHGYPEHWNAFVMTVRERYED